MIEVDSASAVPPSEQIRLQILSQVSDGSLIAGTRIPTVRRLAKDLGLATNTVSKAYKSLERAGILVTRGRAGSFVAPNGDIQRRNAHEAAVVYVKRMKQLGIEGKEAVALIGATFVELN